MRLVTVATHSERYFPLLQASCRRFGCKLEVLCWGQRWRGYVQKLTAVLDYLAPLAEDEVVCLVDAFDTLLLQSPTVLEQRFRESGAKMVLAADGEPTNHVVRFFVHRVFPAVNGVYMNSGTYVAYAGHLRRLLKHVLGAGYTSNNDQEMLARFCSTHDGWINVDTQSELFLTLYLGSSWTFTNEMSETRLSRTGVCFVDDKELGKPVLRWAPTGTSPVILHAPCDGNFNYIARRLGYQLPKSVVEYGSVDHLQYMWRATKTYMPLIWDDMLLAVLLAVLLVLAVYTLARATLRRSTPLASAATLRPAHPPRLPEPRSKFSASPMSGFSASTLLPPAYYDPGPQ